jgi:cobalamin biosynthetic protein CobC
MVSEALAYEGTNPLAHHGGNLDAARLAFPGAELPWIDLSTGINADPYPAGVVSAAAWHRLPDPSEVAALEVAAARAYGATQDGCVVAAPGTQAIIQWLPRLLSARRVGILGPTYGEHETSWRAAGAEVALVGSIGELRGFDVAVIVNPNNPDGRLLMPADLTGLAGAAPTLVVDEAFMDVVRPSASLVPHLPRQTMVLRSFGKAYGLAGARLGFAVVCEELAQRLRRALGPWAVSGPAIEIGRRALADAAWLTASVDLLEQGAARLDELLLRAGFRIVGGTPLFRLAERTDARSWFERLGRRGILVRPFGWRETWLRFGIPSGEATWRRLEDALGGAEPVGREPAGR